MSEEMLTYGLKKGTKNELLHIDSVGNGLSCGCVCPHCGEALEACQGDVRQHFFRHASGTNCPGARMTALHMMAQKALERDKTVMLPAYEGLYYQHEAENIDFDIVDLEVAYEIEGKLLRPDCVGVVADKEGKEHSLWIEIYVTHEVDEEKIKHIKDSGISCIEIDLSDMLEKGFNEEDIAERLVKSAKSRKWINCPKCDKLEELKRIEIEKEKQAQEQREAAERERELELAKKELEYEKYLKHLSSSWHSQPNRNLVERILKEIRRKPYLEYDEDDVRMCDFLVPDFKWATEYQNFPRCEEGVLVFNCLIHYYYKNIKLDDHSYKRWTYIDGPMWQLLKTQNLTREETILLEYVVVLWAINLLNNHKRYKDRDSALNKTFANNSNVRKGLIKVIHKGEDRSYFLKEEVRKQIKEELKNLEDGDVIYEIFNICFPLHQDSKSAVLDKSSSIQVNPESIRYEKHGNDKEFDGKDIDELWKLLNQAFQEQSHK